MLNNYFNPQAADPGTGFKPEGFLGGMVWADRDARYRQLSDLQTLLAKQSVQSGQNELDEYAANAPVRDVERRSKLLTTMPDAEFKAQDAKTKAYRSALEAIDLHEPALRQAQGTPTQQAAYDDFIRSIPPDLARHFPKQFNPGVLDHISMIRDKLVNTPSQQAEINKIDRQAQYHSQDVRTTADATMYSADARAEATMFASLQKGIGKANAQKVEAIINRYLSKMMDGGEPTPQETRAFMAAQQILNNYRAAGAGADPTMFKWNFLNTPSGQPQPAPGRPIPGPVDPKELEIQRRVEQSGLKYEPQIYDYRISPDGRLQRARK